MIKLFSIEVERKAASRLCLRLTNSALSCRTRMELQQELQQELPLRQLDRVAATLPPVLPSRRYQGAKQRSRGVQIVLRSVAHKKKNREQVPTVWKLNAATFSQARSDARGPHSPRCQHTTLVIQHSSPGCPSTAAHKCGTIHNPSNTRSLSAELVSACLENLKNTKWKENKRQDTFAEFACSVSLRVGNGESYLFLEFRTRSICPEMDSAKPDVAMRSCEMGGTRLRTFTVKLPRRIPSPLDRKRILEPSPARCRSPRGKNVVSFPLGNGEIYLSVHGTRSISSDLDSELPDAPTDGGLCDGGVLKDGRRELGLLELEEHPLSQRARFECQEFPTALYSSLAPISLHPDLDSHPLQTFPGKGSDNPNDRDKVLKDAQKRISIRQNYATCELEPYVAPFGAPRSRLGMEIIKNNLLRAASAERYDIPVPLINVARRLPRVHQPAAARNPTSSRQAPDSAAPTRLINLATIIAIDNDPFWTGSRFESEGIQLNSVASGHTAQLGNWRQDDQLDNGCFVKTSSSMPLSALFHDPAPTTLSQNPNSQSPSPFFQPPEVKPAVNPSSLWRSLRRKLRGTISDEEQTETIFNDTFPSSPRSRPATSCLLHVVVVPAGAGSAGPDEDCKNCCFTAPHIEDQYHERTSLNFPRALGGVWSARSQHKLFQVELELLELFGCRRGSENGAPCMLDEFGWRLRAMRVEIFAP
ncbi:hypothetical protein BDZ89DRAFT_1038362 [Hymenopellis radicata]|nr:hypothetical protein BDZ89DRAFT_1038362 [Hymenopellis radicata]